MRQPLPAAVIIDASQRAIDPASGDNWKRIYVYVFSVIESLDDPPFRAERNLGPQSPRVAELLAEFQRWFEGQRASLEELARAQQAEMDAAERVIATAKCR